jgi:hypothetical protein
MIDEENKEQKELEVKLDDDANEKEVEIPENPIDKLVQSAEEEQKEEAQAVIPEKKEVKAPPYSELEDKLSNLESKTFDIAHKKYFCST